MPAAQRIYGHPWDRLHPFDRTWGTDTSGTVPVAQLSSNRALSDHAVFYAGSQPSVVRASLAVLPDLNGSTFIDLGCGKGRALLVAAESPFARLIGVELSTDLARIARRNAQIIARRRPDLPDIQVFSADASAFPLPSGDVVIYMYHPFEAPVMTKVVAGIEAALMAESRRIFVIYCNPVAGHCFDASPRLTRRFAATLSYSDEDLGYGPDVGDPVVIWQGGSVPPPPRNASLDARIVIAPPRRRVILQWGS